MEKLVTNVLDCLSSRGKRSPFLYLPNTVAEAIIIHRACYPLQTWTLPRERRFDTVRSLGGAENSYFLRHSVSRGFLEGLLGAGGVLEDGRRGGNDLKSSMGLHTAQDQ